MGFISHSGKSKKEHLKDGFEQDGSLLYEEQDKQLDETHVNILASEVQKKIDMQSKSLTEEEQDENSVEAQVRKAKKEEERYDQLLNSVQAKNLIKTVDQINIDKKRNLSKTVQTKKNVPIQSNIVASKRVISTAFQDKKDADDINDEKDEDNYYIDNLDNDLKDDQSVLFHNDADVDSDSKTVSNLEKAEEVDVNLFQRTDLKKYITSQCEIMEEATSHVDEAMEEYSDVTEYFTDIQKIEQAPDNIKENIENLARRVNDLSVDRRISKTNHNRLSTSAYHRMEKYENEIPRGFQYIKKQESYYETVKRDMRILEGEQLGFRLEARMLAKRQLKIKTFSLASIIGLIVAFVVFLFALSFINEDEYVVFYISVALIGAIIAVGLFALQKYTERQVLLTEIKLNKTSNLLNKTKIKYINAANTLDYEYGKYRIKNSYELEKKYQAYIEMKEEQKKALSMTSTLNDAQQELESVLNTLSLFDTHVWIGQVKALYNPKEMVEVRHELTTQRQKLRNLIEYNEQKIEEAKRNIKAITIKYPEYTQFALGIINEYEMKKSK